MAPTSPSFLLHFLIHIDVLILFRKFELIPTKTVQVMAILKNKPIFEITLYYSPCFFLKNASKFTPPPFLLHFLIHMDVLMLCRKFELIPTKTVRVMGI